MAVNGGRYSNGSNGNGRPNGSGNGHNGNGSAGAGKKESVESGPPLPAAAQMPKAGEIPEKRRRPRLLDRITGLAKS